MIIAIKIPMITITTMWMAIIRVLYIHIFVSVTLGNETVPIGLDFSINSLLFCLATTKHELGSKCNPYNLFSPRNKF